MKPDELYRARAMLCDLLIGRFLRLSAYEALDSAVEAERIARANEWTIYASFDLERAAELERIAALAEQGLVFWGGRYNRDGIGPEEEVRP